MFKTLSRSIKYPLGRWHNSGEYFNEKFLILKEKQKEIRFEYKEKKIDPYVNLEKEINEDEDDYMIPFIIDW